MRMWMDVYIFFVILSNHFFRFCVFFSTDFSILLGIENNFRLGKIPHRGPGFPPKQIFGILGGFGQTDCIFLNQHTCLTCITYIVAY